MFNLNHAISVWLSDLRFAGLNSSEVLAELEIHLREEIERQIESGLEESEAFMRATELMGSVDQISQEFQKTPPATISSRPWLVLSVGLGIAWILLVTFKYSFGPGWRPTELLPLAPISLGLIAYLCSLLFANRWTHPGARLGIWQMLVLLFIFCSAPDPVLQLLLFLGLLPASTIALRAAPGQESGTLVDLDSFDVRSRETLQFARDVANEFGHDFIGTEHALLGLVREPASAVTSTLRDLGTDVTSLRSEIETLVGAVKGRTPKATMPWTPRLKKALSLAQKEAANLHHHSVRPEHLFLGLLREGNGVAAVVLKGRNIHLESAREQLRKRLSSE